MGWRPLHRACFAGLAEVAGGHWQLTSKVLDSHGGIPEAMKDHPKREGPMVFRVQKLSKASKTSVFLCFFSGAHEVNFSSIGDIGSSMRSLGQVYS